MIEALIKSLDGVFDNLDWIEVYGGLVETYGRKIGTGQDTTEETFPVKKGTPVEKCGDACLQLLTPDSRKKAVVFWEMTSDATPSQPKNISRANGLISFTQSARLIVWLNFTGCKDCTNTSYLAYVNLLVNALNRRRVQSEDPVGASGRLKLTGVPVRDFRTVFGAWTFGQNQRLFTHPFDFFALEVTFDWFQNATCPTLPTC